MVSQDSPPNPASNIFHHFIVSDSMAAQNQQQHQLDHHASYGSNYPPHSLGLLPSIHSLEERMSRSIDIVQAPPHPSEDQSSAHMSHTRHMMDQQQHQAQRLSLSLGSHMLLPPNSHPVQYMSDDYSSFMGNAPASSSSSNSQMSHHQSLAALLGSSRYLKPTQALLDELVSAGGKSIDISSEIHIGKMYGDGRRCSMSLSSELKAELCCNGGLMSSEKPELQAKIANLITLLEEVEDRCEKYYHQMEEVMSSFEVVVGAGAAKCYTALALKAMSRHFGSLRDAIVAHIHAENRKLRQDVTKVSSGLAQLSLFDRECRQKRMSLQQLGLLQSRQTAWRPIRGLPETSVAILRTWLFKHFLHPYPNDSEKLMLASQTGLSKNQVSNWFINARVRLWKPMIEEMYKEEFGESSQDSNPQASSSMTGESNTDHTED